MSHITVRLKELSKLKLIYDKNIHLYIPIKGAIKVLVNSKPITLGEADVFLLNSYQVGLFSPNFEQGENLFFELELNSSVLSEDKYQDLTFNNLIKNMDEDFILSHLAYLYHNNFSSFEEKELIDKLLNHLLRLEVVRDKDQASKDLEKKLIGTYLDDLKYSSKMIDINMDSLSKTYGVSASNFSKTFKKVTGFTLANFKQLYRLENAAKLLEKSDKPLDDIASQVGYHSSKSLYDAYKNNMDILPSTYRKLVRKNIDKSNKDLASSQAYKDFINRINPINYQRVYQEYSDYNKYELNIDDAFQKFDYQGINLYNLNTIGDNHLKNISQINEDLKINYILLDLNLNEELKDLIYLESSRLYLTKTNLLELLELLSKENIQVGIAIDIGNLNYTDYGHRHYQMIEAIQNFLLESISYQIRKDYQWIVRLEKIKNIDLADNYLYKRKTLLQKTFGPDLELAVFLGDIRLDRLDFLTSHLLEDKKAKDISKIYFNLVYDIDLSLLDIQSSQDLYGQLDYDFRSVIYKINDFKNYIDITVLHFIVETDKNKDNLAPDELAIYNDLIMNYIYLTNFTYMKDELMYFIIFDRPNKIKYMPHLMRDKQLKTPTYFLLKFLRTIKGNIIQSPPGILAIKDGFDIHLIVKNNLYIDYVYSKDKNYKGLEDDKRKIDIELFPLYGKYRINQYLINYKRSNPLTSLESFNTEGFLTEDDRAYLEDITQPQRKVDLVEISNSHTIEIELDPFSISYIHLQKM